MTALVIVGPSGVGKSYLVEKLSGLNEGELSGPGSTRRTTTSSERTISTRPDVKIVDTVGVDAEKSEFPYNRVHGKQIHVLYLVNGLRFENARSDFVQRFGINRECVTLVRSFLLPQMYAPSLPDVSEFFNPSRIDRLVFLALPVAPPPTPRTVTPATQLRAPAVPAARAQTNQVQKRIKRKINHEVPSAHDLLQALPRLNSFYTGQAKSSTSLQGLLDGLTNRQEITEKSSLGESILSMILRFRFLGNPQMAQAMQQNEHFRRMLIRITNGKIHEDLRKIYGTDVELTERVYGNFVETLFYQVVMVPEKTRYFKPLLEEILKPTH